MTKRRIAITGLGMVTSLGHNVRDTWQAVLAGKSGATPIGHFDASAFTTRFSSSVRDFDVSPYMETKEAKRFDPFIQFGVAAAHQAIADAGLEVRADNAHRIGTAIGSGIGGIGLIEKSHAVLTESGPRKLSPFIVPGSIINMISGMVSIRFGMKGPNIATATACTTATHAIGLAARMISYGDADVMVAGGAEMATTPVGLGGFAAARALSTRNDNPQAASRPWDRDRDGFVLGDGAGVLVLEEFEHARKRGAKIYAELIGFGMSADAFHMTAPPEEGEGAGRAMLSALQDGGINADQLDYINAHGTSTPAGDIAESRAVERLMGGAASRVAMSSTKSMTGHLLGAAGGVEAIFTALSIHEQVAPPTINLDSPDEGCTLDYVPHEARQMTIRYALSNSFGFGGTNGSLLFAQVS